MPGGESVNVGALHPGHPAPPTGTVARAPVATVPPFERPPRLRRIAAMIDERASSCNSPAGARKLACRMRLRASELEAGADFSDADETARLQAEMAGE